MWNYHGVDPSVEEVWSRYQAERDPDTRNRLLLQYSPLVKFYAGRVEGDSQEVITRGLEALTAAIDSYELGNGSFETHAMSSFEDAYSWDSGWTEQ